MRTSIFRVLCVAAVVSAAACQDNTTTGLTPAADANAEMSASQRVYSQIDRLANPLVSEVTVVKKRHELYNITSPTTDVSNFTGDVSGFVSTVAGRDPAYAATIAGALLPDMLLTYPKRDGTPVFWLSWVFGGYGGRSLNDDVVDIGLGAIFGNLLGNNNNVTPGLSTDNVSANDVPFRTTFPYLGAAH
jgi:hypothetical protein